MVSCNRTQRQQTYLGGNGCGSRDRRTAEDMEDGTLPWQPQVVAETVEMPGHSQGHALAVASQWPSYL